MLRGLHQAVAEFTADTQPLIHSTRPWTLGLSFQSRLYGHITIRSATRFDVPTLTSFASRLGSNSQQLFAPYPWDGDASDAFTLALERHQSRDDASFFILVDDAPIAHMILWRARYNAGSSEFGVHVPQMALAVIDEFQQKGFGKLGVRILQHAARSLDAHAIELTTAYCNKRARVLYESTGFEHVGDIRIPLGRNVAESQVDSSVHGLFRDEHQMAYTYSATASVRTYLREKRLACPVLTESSLSLARSA